MTNLIKVPDTANTNTTTTITPTTSTTLAPSVLEPQGLVWPYNNSLSNAKYSKDIVSAIGISDFNIFNPYIHYISTGNTATTISTSGSLTAASKRFEIYSSKFRNYNDNNKTSTTTTTTPPPRNDCISTVLVSVGNNRYAVYCVDANGNQTRLLEYT